MSRWARIRPKGVCAVVPQRFRTRVVEIEAVRWTGDNLDEIQEFTGTRTVDGYTSNIFELMGTYLPAYLNDGFTGEVFDKLHNTWIAVADGQWIVRGVKGEFYPCDDETFHWKYEEVK